MKKLISIIRRKIGSFFERKKKRKVAVDDVSIISCSCLGGVLYHRYRKQFLSPTINLFIDTPDFIRFCLDIKKYLSYDLKFLCMRDEYNYPVALLGDIKIYFVHYKTFEEAKEFWDRRKTRLNFDKIYVICSDRDFFNPSLIDGFLKIPYKKVFFSHVDYGFDDCVFVSMDRNKNSIGLLTDFISLDGTRRCDKYFDFDKWLTGQFDTKDCKK